MIDSTNKTYYENNRILNEYLLFHYGAPEEILSLPNGPSDALNFQVRCVDFLIKHSQFQTHNQALDLGCAVGRASFELARYANRVLGIDYSVQFIKKANELKCNGATEFESVSEGGLVDNLVAKIPEGIDTNCIDFIQGDACDLPMALGGFDLVLMANLIDRLPKPRACLKSLSCLVKQGGVALITSPYTWMEEYTPKEEWLGGFMKNGEPVKSIETLRTFLEDDFELLECLDLPFIIREHIRKFQWTVAQGSVWRRL